MRVLLIGWEYPPHIAGGLGIACEGLARSLAARGHQVRFLLPRLYGDEPRVPGLELTAPEIPADLTPAERARLEQGLSDLAHSVEVISPYDSHAYAQGDGGVSRSFGRLGTGGTLELEGGYGLRLYREIGVYAEMAAIMARRQKPDIIYAHDWMCYPAGLAAKAASGSPLVCHVHATEFDRSGDHPNQYVYDLEHRAVHECDHVIAVSRYTKDILVNRYAVPASKVSVVYNGVDLDRAGGPAGQGERPIRDQVVLFLGRMTFQKGPDYFVRAAQLVIQRMPNVRFVMAGGGDMYHRMIEFAADLGIGAHFHYTGPLSREDVRRLYRTSDLYILPSVSEPFGITPLEAISHGVPVIISKQAGVGELVEGCLKVDFWNVEELAEKIVTLLRNAVLADSLREQSQAEVRRITWGRSAEKLESVFESLMAAQR